MEKLLTSIMLLCVSLLCHALNSSTDQSTDYIKRIDIAVDSILNVVVNDAYNRMSNGTVPGYYSILMNAYKGGTLVKVVKSQTDTYDIRDHWEGYVELDGNVMVVDFGFSMFRPVFTNSSDSVAIHLKRFDDSSHIMDIKYYYILDDCYAIYYPESGWIWSDGIPDE